MEFELVPEQVAGLSVVFTVLYICEPKTKENSNVLVRINYSKGKENQIPVQKYKIVSFSVRFLVFLSIALGLVLSM